MSSFSWSKIPHPFLCLAPLAGISDSPFRQICKKFGAELVFTEMISAEGLEHQGPKTLELIRFHERERPIILQLFGKNPKSFAAAARLVENLPSRRKPDGIDLNLGCPARKVKAHGSGAILMTRTKLVNQIIKAITDNTQLPFSIKMRAGVEKENVTAVSFLQKIALDKIQAISVHGRTLEQGFSGPIDYGQIAQIKKIVGHKIVIGNGGITDFKTAKTMLQKTKVDGMMIGQGAYGNPWIFQNIKNGLRQGKILIADRPFLETVEVALDHARLMVRFKGEEKGMREMRKHLFWYFCGFPQAKHLRSKLVRVQTLSQTKKILKEFSQNKGLRALAGGR